MNLFLLILILGIGYILVFGGLGLLRREGLSNRFALEGLAVTLAALAFSLLTGQEVNPVLFLVVIYVVTMRARMLVDLGTLLAGQERVALAGRCYDLATRVWPDEASQALIKVNQGTLLLRQGRLEEAIELLEKVLGAGEDSHLGIRYEAAAHYNLGVAYRRAGRDAAATKAFNEVIGLMPGSVFAIRAEQALVAGKRKPADQAEARPEQPSDEETR